MTEEFSKNVTKEFKKRLQEEKEINQEFDKLFPSIANQGWEMLGQVVSFSRILNKDEKKIILKHCRDNQRIKEAIDKILMKGTATNWKKLQHSGGFIRKRLLEELGLK